MGMKAYSFRRLSLRISSVQTTRDRLAVPSMFVPSHCRYIEKVLWRKLMVLFGCHGLFVHCESEKMPLSLVL